MIEIILCIIIASFVLLHMVFLFKRKPPSVNADDNSFPYYQLPNVTFSYMCDPTLSALEKLERFYPISQNTPVPKVYEMNSLLLTVINELREKEK